MDCPNLPQCPFFNLAMTDMPATAAGLKEQFCRGDFERCARRKVALTLGRQHVPLDMFPDDFGQADRILAAAAAPARSPAG